ncbi:MAG: hypothetical protein KDC27_01225 [Acidobacteria bacterium]|nr:hypothetical protein [Acidobacteriota bacterium]
MSPKPPVSIDRLRALRQSPEHSDGTAEPWYTVPNDEADEPPPGFVRENLGLLILAAGVVVALVFLLWAFADRYQRLAAELDQTKLALASATEEIARTRSELAEATVIHELWSMGSRFGESSASACGAEDDQNRVRAATAEALEMWSDSAVRSELDLESSLLPALRALEKQGVHVAGATLPASVVAQYRHFHRASLGDTILLDPARITDSASRTAVLELLRRVGEASLDPEKTTVLYRYDDYGKVSYRVIQGAADASLLQAKLADDPRAAPITVSAAEFPCQ